MKGGKKVERVKNRDRQIRRKEGWKKRGREGLRRKRGRLAM